jgi:hypothetical protein
MAATTNWRDIMAFSAVLLVHTEDTELNYNTMFQVPTQYVGQAIAMARVFQDAIDPSSLKFQFGKALEIVHAHDEMAVIGTVNQSIVKQAAEVSAMVQDVVKLLSTVVGIALDEGSDTYKKFVSTIEQGFTNLAAQQDSAWIFWSSEQEHKTTYTYNILFAIANKKTGSVMAAAPIGLTVEVNVQKEKVLWITIKDKHDYTVNVQSITVVEALKTTG